METSDATGDAHREAVCRAVEKLLAAIERQAPPAVRAHATTELTDTMATLACWIDEQRARLSRHRSLPPS